MKDKIKEKVKREKEKDRRQFNAKALGRRGSAKGKIMC